MQSNKRLVVCAVIVMCCLAGIAAAGKPACDTSSLAGALAKSNNIFAVNLYQQLRSQDGNIFFSPYSIHTALAMTHAGARGETASQMKTALSFTLSDADLNAAFAESIRRLNTGGDNYEMNVANSLWSEKTHTFLKPFIDVNKNSYDGGLELVDFIHASESARIKINAWVEEQTRQKITNLIPPGGVNADTRMALVNAVYFKGLWAKQFDKKRTQKAPFYCADGTTVEAPLMSFSETRHMPFYSEEGLKIIELDYQGENISMLILLPDTAGGLGAIEQKLNDATLNRWVSGLSRCSVQVSLPRFTLTWDAHNIVPELQTLGMRDAFDAGAADFSGIDGTRDLLISSVFHKAFVDVYEEGTEAAAATGVMVGVTSMPPPPEIFRADRPFLFLIREKATGAILFMGRLTEPEKN